MIPAGYNESGDADIHAITAQVTTKTQPQGEEKPDDGMYGGEMTKKERYKAKWDSIRNGNKDNKKITPQDITKLSKVASNVLKKGKGSFLVVIDDRNNFQLITVNNREKQQIPTQAIVGGLANLFDTMVNANTTHDQSFFNKQRNKVKQSMDVNSSEPESNDTEPESNDVESDVNNDESQKIPHNKSSFFKR
jgi:hypothetical protein